jgi:hypothetical protein
MAELDGPDIRTAAVTAVSIDVQVGKMLAEREAVVIATAVNTYNALKLSPEMALAFWGQMAELGRLDALLETRARKAVQAVERAEAEHE